MEETYKKLSKDDQDTIIEEALERYKRADEYEEDNRGRAQEAIEFRDGDQWPEEVRRERETDPEGIRPTLTLDKTNQYLHQIENNERQMRPAIKIRPVDDKADPETAKVLQGLIRNIEDQSRAHVAYDTAYSHAVDGGYGYFRILTDYADDQSFYQDLIIKRIRNRFCVRLDPDRQEPDGADSKFGFISESLLKEEFERQYPDAECQEWGEADYKEAWLSKDKIRVCEYYRLKPINETLLLLDNDEVVDRKTYDEATHDSHPELFREIPPDLSGFIYDEAEDTFYNTDGSVVDVLAIEPEYEKVNVIKERKRTRHQLCWYKLTSLEVLDWRELPGKYIPIIEVIGEEVDINGESRKSGVLRRSMDAQRLYNYSASAYTEMVALAPKAPFIAAAGQLEGYEEDWREANVRNISVLHYNPMDVNEQLVPPPQRQPMPGIPTGWSQALVGFEHDIQSAMGLYNPSVGKEGMATSGKQEWLLQQKGDVGTFHYIDNLALSIAHAGRILIDLIPHYYDTKRIVRVLGEDGEPEMVQLDPNIPMAKKEFKDNNQRKKKIFNVHMGKYDVSVSTGPSYASKRQETVEMLSNLIRGNPEMLKLVGDLLFSNMDQHEADRVAERLRKMLPLELQGDDEEEENAVNQKLLMVIEQMKAQMKELAEGQEARKIANEQRELEIKEMKAETERMAEIGKLKLEAQQQQLDKIEAFMEQLRKESQMEDGNAQA